MLYYTSLAVRTRHCYNAIVQYQRFLWFIIMLAASSEKRNVTVWHPSVCLVGILTLTHQGAACDAASVHFGPTTRRTDIFVIFAPDFQMRTKPWLLYFFLSLFPVW